MHGFVSFRKMLRPRWDTAKKIEILTFGKNGESKKTKIARVCPHPVTPRGFFWVLTTVRENPIN